MKAGVFAAMILGIALAVPVQAQVPQTINFQGRVTVGGTNFDGIGLFEFALMDGGATTNYWSNDGTPVGEPANAVSLVVSKGLYSVLLGDTTISNMTAIPVGVFNNSNVTLRVWFNDGVHGFQQLTPDQRLAACGYSMQSQVAYSVLNSLNVQVFDSNGVFVVPVGAKKVMVEVWGAGGSGGPCCFCSVAGGGTFGGGGGGGGGYAKGIVNVTPGSNITVTVGVGGGVSSNMSFNGGTSSFGSFISATGGQGGYVGNSSSGYTAPGGVGIGGFLSLTGVAGLYPLVGGSAGSGYGGAGGADNGGIGGTNTPGGIPGGGGAGGNTTPGQLGGPGGNGKVIVYY